VWAVILGAGRVSFCFMDDGLQRSPKPSARAPNGAAPRWFIAVLCALGSALLWSAPAGAERAPSRAERAALVRDGVCHRPRSYCRGARVVFVRVSTKGPYALVGVAARRGFVHIYQGNTVLLRGHGRRWRIVSTISGEGVPCTVPPAVREDLQLAKYSANGSVCNE